MTDNDTPESNPPVAEKPRGRAAARAALLFSLIALGGSAYLGWFLLAEQRDVFQAALPDTVEQLRTEVDTLRQSARTMRYDLDRLRENQETLTGAMRSATQHLSTTRVDWIMSEVEQLLLVANQRVQLAGDLDTAATALDIADQRLRDLSDPDLTPVRKQLAKEIDLLKSAQRADLTGIALRLGNLIDKVEALPLSLEFQLAETAAASAPAPQKETKGFFSEVWADIRSLISIRTNVETYKPLLPPERQYFLRENLRLVLAGAQQAALRGDSTTFKANLRRAQEWMTRYFDAANPNIRQAVADLNELAKSSLDTERPVISGSLKSLRDVMRKKRGA
jgi:uncharacterized protein HemX